MDYGVIFGVLVVVLCSVFCQEIPENSCQYFWYTRSQYNHIYGRLILPNDGSRQLDLHVTASIRGVYQSLPNLSIQMATSANELHSRGGNIEYWINFPFWDPIPKITQVTLNGNTYCSGSAIDNDYGMGTTTMWAQYTYTLGDNDLMWYPQYSQSTQSPSEKVTPVASTSETTSPPQIYTELSTSPQQNINTGYHWGDSSETEETLGAPVTSYDPPLYTSKIPIATQGSFELPDSSENSLEYSVPLKSSSYTPPPFTSKLSISQHFQYYLNGGDSSEDSTEDTTVSSPTSTEEAPLILSKLDENPEDTMANNHQDEYNGTTFLRQCGTPNDDTAYRIFNGRSTIQGQYPWLAALLLADGTTRGSYKCVANLISERHLLTAAHCVSQFTKENLLLRFYSPEETGQPVFEYFRSITDVTISPYYITEPFGDVALLTINQSVIYLGETMKPICLWGGGKELDYTGTVAGWGLDENEMSGIGTPKAIDISMVPPSKCIETYGLESDYRLFSDYCFCTAHNKAMPCRGDSGAGFMVQTDGRYFLRGIVSVGYRFCGRSSYTIFVDIVPHLNWIMRFLDQQMQMLT